jgi:hypothetical protein
MDTGELNGGYAEARDFAAELWKEVRHKYYRHIKDGNQADADGIEFEVHRKIMEKYPDIPEKMVVFVSHEGRDGGKYFSEMRGDTAMGFLLDGKESESQGDPLAMNPEYPTVIEDDNEIVDLVPQNPEEVDPDYKKNKGDNTIAE